MSGIGTDLLEDCSMLWWMKAECATSIICKHNILCRYLACSVGHGSWLWCSVVAKYGSTI